MTDADWGAWTGATLLVKAAALGSVDAARILARLRDPGLAFDTYKGAPGSFRDWDGQLRQPVLLHTGDAVAGRAPYERFLHRTSVLDTLGRDQPESDCHF